MRKKDELNVAWAAGIIEGEGYISNGAIAVTMTDKDVLDRLASVFPGGHVSEMRKRAGRKTPWRWGLYKQELIRATLVLIRPWLGTRRGKKADEVYSFLKARMDFCPNGHERTAENTYWYKGGRHCRLCRAAASKRYEPLRSDRRAYYRARYESSKDNPEGKEIDL